MRKLSQTEELVKILAGRARRHTLTPEQISRAMDEQEYDVSGLDALYAELEARGIRVAEEEPDVPLLDEAQIGRLEHELSAEGVALDDPVKAYLKEIGRVPLLSAEEEAALALEKEVEAMFRQMLDEPDGPFAAQILEKVPAVLRSRGGLENPLVQKACRMQISYMLQDAVGAGQ